MYAPLEDAIKQLVTVHCVLHHSNCSKLMSIFLR